MLSSPLLTSGKVYAYEDNGYPRSLPVPRSTSFPQKQYSRGGAGKGDEVLVTSTRLALMRLMPRCQSPFISLCLFDGGEDRGGDLYSSSKKTVPGEGCPSVRGIKGAAGSQSW